MKNKVILLVEDNLINQQVITQQLRTLGYTAEIASNGEEGYKMWKSGRYALILMDCHMPKMDGFESTATIRLDEKKSNALPIPIIAITANAMQGEKDHCIDAGMNDYLSKPTQLNVLAELLSRWLPE